MNKMHEIMSVIALIFSLAAYCVFAYTDGGIVFGVMSLWALIIHVKQVILFEMERGK